MEEEEVEVMNLVFTVMHRGLKVLVISKHRLNMKRRNFKRKKLRERLLLKSQWRE